MNILTKIETIIDRASRLPNYYDVQLAWGYAEPGYNNAESGYIALANWNPKSFDRPTPKAHNTMPRLSAILSKLGVDCEWEDELASCSDCGKLVRITADSYGWQPYYWMPADGGEIYCGDCVLKDPTGYLEELENSLHCMDLPVKLSHYGYEQLLGKLESGFYPGQADSPEKIANFLRDHDITRFIFSRDSVGQFDCHFSVWGHTSQKAQIDACKEQCEDADLREYPTPAMRLKQGLRQASAQSAQLCEAEGIRYSKIDVATGTSTTRLVTPEEFIAGIKE